MKPGILILPAVCLLGGCSVFPDYVRPKLDTPEHWHAKTKNGSRSANLIDWWKQFNDPVLVKLLQAAESSHPSLDKAVAGIASARANLESAEASGLPGITGNASFKRSKGGNSYPSGAAGSAGTGMEYQSASGFNNIYSNSIIQILSGSLDASWEIDLFGKIRFNQQAEQARLEAEQLNWHYVKISLASEVAGDYVSFRACELKVSAYEQALTSKQETFRLTHILTRSGFSAPADAALADASLQASASTLIAQRAECDKTIKSLVALTNLGETELRALLAERRGIPQPAQFSVDSVPADLLKQRPDLASDERNLAAASADIGTATAKRYPSLTLTGSIGKRKTESSGIRLSTNTWSIGPNITLPIFDGGELRAKVASAQAGYGSALATLHDDIRTAVKEVEQALVDLDSAEQREIRERISAEQYRTYFRAAEINWRAGGLSLLLLEDARSQMINQDISYINQQQNRVQYWIALYKALGGGWSADNDLLIASNSLNEASK